MQKSHMSALAASALLLISILLYFEFMTDRTDPTTVIEREAAANASISNPLAIEKLTINVADLEKSFACVDSIGIMRCGKYENGAALYYAALLGSREYLHKFSTPELLRLHGNIALNVAAALGDLDTVKLITEQADKHGILGDTKIDDHAAIQAARFGNVEILRFFVARGFEIKEKFSDGYSDVFVEALMGQQSDVAAYLFESGYEINCAFRFPNGKGYLDVAQALKLSRIESMIIDACPQGTAKNDFTPAKFKMATLETGRYLN